MRFNTPTRFLFLLGAVGMCATGATHLASAGTNPVAKSVKVQRNSVASTAVAKSASQRGAGNEKYTVCHKGHEISVAASAVPAHLAHGDSQGACTPSQPPQGL
jgi:hypothetical protein